MPEPSWDEGLRLRLAETIAWVSSPFAGSLRTPAFWSPSIEYEHNALLESPVLTRGAVAFIADRRREALRARAIAWTAHPGLAGGRILCTDFNTDFCEAAVEPSEGFLDPEDIPAWDTWFHHWDTGEFGGVVACWVPPSRLDAVDRGLSVLPIQCAWWDDAPPQGVRRFLTDGGEPA